MMNNYEEQLKEQLKEIDKDNRSLQQENIYLREKCKELQIIVKEVREYIMSELIDEWDIENGGCVSGSDLPVDAITPILEILDKENK